MPAACARCGSDLAADSIEGHCPSCLAHFAFLETEAEENAEVSFGDYDLLEEIARGGMGVIYRARQRSLNRFVAVKMLISGEFASAEFKRRLRHEAKAAASLQHPNIVAIHEIGEQSGQPFFSMELVEGQNLGELAREQPLPSRRSAEYVKKIAEAIAYAHEKGILHRDLKPSNIIIDCFDQPRVTDFGLAKQFLAPSDLTRPDQSFGSPAYMAPEQSAKGGASRIGPTVDIYSLGALLYHLLTGRPPFQGETLHQILRQVQEVEPIAPRLLNPAIAADLETICLKCLEKDPGRRYGSAADVAEELGRFLAGEPIRARAISRTERVWRWCGRNPALATLSGAVATLIVLLLAGSWMATWRIERARKAETREHERATQANAQLANANSSLEESITTIQLQRAEQSFHAGDASLGLAQLASLVRRHPANRIAAERAVSALLHRNWILPQGKALLHPAPVNSLSLSASGKYIATACADGFARVWDVERRELLCASPQHPSEVRCVSFNLDEKQIATGGRDGTVRIWNWRTGDVKEISIAPNEWIFSVAFSADGEFLVVGCADTTAVVLSMRGQQRVVLRGHKDGVRDAVFSPDGRLVATASNDQLCQIWNAATGERVGPFLRNPFAFDAMRGVAFSPGGVRLATASRDRTALVWNVDAGTMALPALRHPDGLNAVTFDGPGRVIATASFDNSVRLWNAQTGDVLSQAFRHLEQVNRVEFTPDGQMLATAGDDWTVKFWGALGGQTLAIPLRHDSTVNWVEFSRDGKLLATASYDKTARIWDAITGKPLTPPLQHAGNVQRVAFSPDNRLVVTASGDGTACVWDVKTGARLKPPFVHDTGLWAASFSPDGARVLTASADGTARLWNVETGGEIGRVLHNEQVFMARFNNDGSRIVTASRDRSARVWDAKTCAPITVNLMHLDDVLDAQFSPDGTSVATASNDNTARIWDARTGAPIGNIIHHLRTVRTVAFSHDGTRVVTASADHTGRIWDAKTGAPLTPALAHDNTVIMACFSPDDQRVVTTSLDGSARIWDGRTGLPRSEPLWHKEPVAVAQFSPDGQRLATGSFSPAYPAHIWQAPVVTLNAPDWLPTLAEAVAGPVAGLEGTTNAVSEEELQRLRERLSQLKGDDAFSRVGRWFVADRAQRTVSPFETQSVAEFVRNRIDDNMREGLEQTILLSPTNALALGRLAKTILAGERNAEAEADSAALARRALRFDPEQADALVVLRSIQKK